MSYGYTPVTPINNTQNIQIVASSVTSNAVTYVPYITNTIANTIQYNAVIPAENVLSPANSFVYTGIQASTPIVNHSPYSVLGASTLATSPYPIYNFSIPTTPSFSVYQFTPATQVSGQIPTSPYTASVVNSVSDSVGIIVNEQLTKVGYNTSPTTKPAGRDNKAGWYEMHQRHVTMISRKCPRVILCGDSIIAGLARYSDVWVKYFRPWNTINCGIGGDRTQHVLWRMENLQLPSTIQFAVLHCGTNNIDRDRPYDIANGVISCGLILQQKCSQVNVIVTGLLPRDLENSYRRTKIALTNKLLKEHCRQFSNFTYMSHDKDWVLENGLLNEQLYYDDHLHLVESGNEKFASSISNIISKLYKNESIVYSDEEGEGVSETTVAQSSNVADDNAIIKTTPENVCTFELQQGEARVECTPVTPLESSVSGYETPVKTKKKKRRHSPSPDSTPKVKKRVKTELRSTSSHDKANFLLYQGKKSNIIQLTNHDTEPALEYPNSSTVNNSIVSNTSNVLLNDSTSRDGDSSSSYLERSENRVVKTTAASSLKASLVGQLSKTLAAPSALVEKIKRSMMQAREELSRKKQALVSPATSSEEFRTGAESVGGSELGSQTIKLIDYSSASDTE